LNHQWRGAESDADAEFVRSLARKYGLPVTVEARKVAGNEDAARSAAGVVRIHRIPNVALAHTGRRSSGDSAVALAARGGYDRSIGMSPEKRIGSLRILRPLFNVRRSEVIEYLKSGN